MTRFLLKNSNYKMLILSHVFIATLLFSLFYNLSNAPFSVLDERSFYVLNSWIKNSFFWQNFWAMANHRWADTLEDVCFVLFFYWVIKSSPKPLRIRKAAECLFFLLFSACVILLANELLFRVLLHIERKSPTLLLNSFTNLAEKITWLKVKFKSPKSFPGDHATTALLFIMSFLYLARNNLRITLAAICYGIFLCLPRLVAGAHWITDVLIGSLSVCLFFFSWAFFTPLASISIKKLEHGIRSIIRSANRQEEPVPHDN